MFLRYQVNSFLFYPIHSWATRMRIREAKHEKWKRNIREQWSGGTRADMWSFREKQWPHHSIDRSVDLTCINPSHRTDKYCKTRPSFANVWIMDTRLISEKALAWVRSIHSLGSGDDRGKERERDRMRKEDRENEREERKENSRNVELFIDEKVEAK